MDEYMIIEEEGKFIIMINPRNGFSFMIIEKFFLIVGVKKIHFCIGGSFKYDKTREK